MIASLLRPPLLNVASALLVVFSSAAGAQAFPSKPIRIVTPFAPGGSTDVMARGLSDGLAKALGQPIIVENKPGAGTVIGNDAVAKSAPDGHTLLLTTSAFAIVPSLHAKLPYPADSAFTPVVLLGRAPNVAIVRADSPLKSAQDLLAQARAHPGKLSYASSGNGTSTHLSAELLKNTAKLFMTHIPYRGASGVVTDVLGGQVDVGFATLPSIVPLLANGKLRALAVTSASRSSLLPKVPTFAEAGVPGYESDNWYGVYVPAGTPAGVVRQLHEVFKRAADTDAFRQRAAAEGLVVSLESPEEARRFLRAEQSKWRKVVTEQSITME